MGANHSGLCRSSLFIRTAADGEVWEFTATVEGGCAIVRGGGTIVVAVADGTEESVELLLEEFLRVTAAAADPAAGAASPPQPPPQPPEVSSADARSCDTLTAA